VALAGAGQTWPHWPQFFGSVFKLTQLTLPVLLEASPHTVSPAAWQLSQVWVQFLWAGWLSGYFLQ
jgi:hypothetical protein